MIKISEERPIWMRLKNDVKIVLCESCNGSGKLRVHNENPMYEGPWTKVCNACIGYGRVARISSVEHVTITDEIIDRTRGECAI
jgi:hypothetical protein